MFSKTPTNWRGKSRARKVEDRPPSRCWLFIVTCHVARCRVKGLSENKKRKGRGRKQVSVNNVSMPTSVYCGEKSVSSSVCPLHEGLLFLVSEAEIIKLESRGRMRVPFSLSKRTEVEIAKGFSRPDVGRDDDGRDSVPNSRGDCFSPELPTPVGKRGKGEGGRLS